MDSSWSRRGLVVDSSWTRRGLVVDSSYSVHGGRTTVTEVVRPSQYFIHASVVGASRIVPRCIREARDGSVNSPRLLRVDSTTYATDINTEP